MHCDSAGARGTLAFRRPKTSASVGYPGNAQLNRRMLLVLQHSKIRGLLYAGVSLFERAIGVILRILAIRNNAPKNKDDLRGEYFRSATHYYVAARYAAKADFETVSGNLFHHAVEMYLKGHLCVNYTKSDLKKWGHNLKRIWKIFKEDVADGSLCRFDKTISRLNKFENIRYPDKVSEVGMRASFQFGRNVPQPKMITQTMREPGYELNIGEIDEITKTIFERSGVNPLNLTNPFNRHASTYLKLCNDFPSLWSKPPGSPNSPP